jgi:hypothetical protein
MPLNRTVRVDRSIQIGRPAADVFSACARIERLPKLVRSVVSVTSCEDVSAWEAFITGRSFHWDVEVIQVIPKQLIGWKSYQGPRHSGQVRFFSLGDTTLVQVQMNYVRDMTPANLFSNSSWSVGDAIEAALRDIRTALESAHPRWTAIPPAETHEAVGEQATGTYGLGLHNELHNELHDGLHNTSRNTLRNAVRDISEPHGDRDRSQTLDDDFKRPPTGEYP